MSVPPRLATWNWWGISALRRRSASAGRPGPGRRWRSRPSRGSAVPWPRRVVGPVGGAPGPSLAGQVSMASGDVGPDARGGHARAAQADLLLHRGRGATTSAGEGPAARSASSITNTPDAVVEALAGDEVARAAAASRTRVTTSPGRTSSRTRSAGRPTSMARSVTSGAFAAVLLVEQVDRRWCRRRPRGPRGRGPRTRWPTSVRASQPPSGITRTKPRSSTCVTIRPISSMWAASIRRGPPPVADADQAAEGVASRRGRTAPRARARTIVADPLLAARGAGRLAEGGEEVHVHDAAAYAQPPAAGPPAVRAWTAAAAAERRPGGPRRPGRARRARAPARHPPHHFEGGEVLAKPGVRDRVQAVVVALQSSIALPGEDRPTPGERAGGVPSSSRSPRRSNWTDRPGPIEPGRPSRPGASSGAGSSSDLRPWPDALAGWGPHGLRAPDGAQRRLPDRPR